MRDAGILTYYTLKNISANGLKPKMALVAEGTAFYDENRISINRAYSAMAANQNIDKLVRAYNSDIPVNTEYVILEDGLQYRISLKQIFGDHVDLTLERLEDKLDVYTDEDSEDTDGTNTDIQP